MLPSYCLAWGPPGHRVIAAIAADNLTPAAARQVEALLGGDAPAAMMAVASWADDIRRERPATASWYFVNIPRGSAGYNAARDCGNNDCVVA